MTKPLNRKTTEVILSGQRPTYPDGRQRINLTKDERRFLAENLQIEQAVALFLDLEQDRNYKQIAEEMGVTDTQLATMIKSPAFQKVYEANLANVGHDPRLKAVVTGMSDLLPSAFRKLKTILSAGDTPPGVALRAVEDLFKWMKVTENNDDGDPQALTNFLKANNVTIQGDLNMLQIGTPQEYKDAMQKAYGTEVVDAEVVDVEEFPTPETISSGLLFPTQQSSGIPRPG
jgi:hypothetical protein